MKSRGTRSRHALGFTLVALAVCSGWGWSPQAVTAQSPDAPLTIDRYVPVVSSAPSMAGQVAQIYVRERVLARTAVLARTLESRVVVFVHGAGTPAEVSFDAPGASWMEYLADAGFDVFSMDMTGYGRSTRPYPMNDPCNLSEAQQRDLIPDVLSETCPATYGFTPTTIESDWNDLDAVVDYVRALRHVDRVHLVAWSLGGPRAGGYAARHPEKVASAVLLSPAYARNRSPGPPAEVPAARTAMTKQSWSDFEALWDRQLGCADQYEPEVRRAVWSAMLESDPVGATWGSGVRRAPNLTTWGWSVDEVAAQRTPMLLVAPETDGQVSPERVVELYEDLGSERKVLVHLACSSHNAMWETNRAKLFAASLEWLRDGTVDGVTIGEVRLSRD